MTDPQILSKLVAEAVVAGYLQGYADAGEGKPLPPSPETCNSLTLNVLAIAIAEFGIQVLP